MIGLSLLCGRRLLWWQVTPNGAALDKLAALPPDVSERGPRSHPSVRRLDDVFLELFGRVGLIQKGNSASFTNHF
ncbi:hypothetical protein [Anditalea andensis]|uniref:hypothetical protein n=1 Tax=Anditalea andensis TaxID=1048983 RepID=UPI0013DF9050|nr:hypothetical protein [Anditalea andensis]